MSKENADTNQNQGIDWWIPAIAIGAVAAVGGAVGIYLARRNEVGPFRNEELPEVPGPDDGAGSWIRMQETVRVDAPVKQVYGFWRDLSNLEAHMRNVDGISENGQELLHWSQKGPLGVWTAEWDAEVVEDKRNTSIAWRSTTDSQVPTAGRVRFDRVKGEDATDVTFTAEFQPPAGSLGAFFGRAVFPMVRRQVYQDLYRIKHAVEHSNELAEA
jgi:uncharacterized membrane protein